jgi:hypothetical protein
VDDAELHHSGHTRYGHRREVVAGAYRPALVGQIFSLGGVVLVVLFLVEQAD